MTRPFSLASLLAVIFLGLLLPIRAAGLPASYTDQEADQWLRENIPAYDAWAKAIDRRGGYVFTHPQDPLGGNFQDELGRRCIGLAESYEGAKRLSLIIFHVANANLEPQHLFVDTDTMEGRITTAEEFARRHLLVVYDGLKAHREALVELEKLIGPLPPEMFLAKAAKTMKEYTLPPFEEWMTSQNMAHYETWFKKQQNPEK